MRFFDNLINMFSDTDQIIFMIKFLTFWVVGIFLTTFTHELAHLIVAKLAKWKVSAFKPYPHKIDGKWVAGAVYCNFENKNINYVPAMLSAPLWKAYFLFATWSILGFLYFPLWAFAIAEFADYASWWTGYFFKRKRSDGFKLRCFMAINCPQKK